MTAKQSAEQVRLDAILPRVTKPARYTGGEWNSIRKERERPILRVALAYPDVYEVGASHLGLQILYELINARPDALAERVYAPWLDMEEQLRAGVLPLFTLESHRPVAAFDLLGFTLPYELTYTNVLNMLDLAALPVRAADRADAHPLVVAGGSCAFNPEPLADFVDLFAIGDGEEVIHDILDALRDSGWRPRRASSSSRREREDFLRRAAHIPGVYVPGLYRVGRSAAGVPVEPVAEGVPRRVVKRFVNALPFAPARPIVPYLEAVHDRAAIEIMRGCARGCRFCQAGVIYRSVRERPVAESLALAEQVLANTGYEELGLLSLSSADHSHIEELVHELARRHSHLSVSLPSLRVDAFSVGLARALPGRKGAFTFAPEAGSQRLRDAINKHVAEEDALRAAEAAFGQGWTLLKLYFMIGLPGETMDDVAGIAALTRQMLAIGRRHQGHRARVNVSVNTFVPKPHTPFQWAAQDTAESLAQKQELLKRELRGAKLSWSDNRVSFLEAALARGDRRLGAVVHNAWRLGARFDAWSDCFRFDLWQEAFAQAGCAMGDYTHRPRALDERLPWDHVDSGVSKAFLKRESLRAALGLFTPDCHVHGQCSACGYFKLDPNCLEAVKRAAVAVNV